VFKKIPILLLAATALLACSSVFDFDSNESSVLPAEFIAPEAMSLLSDENQASFRNSQRQSQLVPADSEYLVFMVDTSGSMFSNPSWNKMLETIETTIDLYPELRGIQVLNDMGDYMLSRYSRERIPNTEEHRQNMLSTLDTWNPYSNSSPLEGLTEIFGSLANNNDAISIYVIGDDLQNSEDSIEAILARISALNTSPTTGEKLARIHSIAFTTILLGPEQFRSSANNYVALMSSVARENGGSFQLLDFN